MRSSGAFLRCSEGGTLKAVLPCAQVEQGFAGLKDVTVVPPDNDDTMQSFWLAETLKYAFLLFGPADVLPLTEWVLNTEAHPLRVLQDSLHLAPTPRPAADVTPA